ncbi:MAG TPA: AAA family ATPase [Alphaproteobacteria bacterium]|nr:AAA family ATPase [Alphaproteobacteria bacterium]
MVSISEQILTVATVLEAVVLLPILIEFLGERRKRRHGVELSLEVTEVAALNGHLAGLDELLADIRDLIDRARHPGAYAELRLGNEILIAGPPLSGKKTLARRIAKDAAFDRIVTVHNPGNADALARAKHLVRRAGGDKVMLVLPRLDLINERADEEVLAELDALIDATSELSHALVIGTTNRLSPNGEVDNLFGVTLMLPGAPVVPVAPAPLLPEVHRMLAGVAAFYIDHALQAGYGLADISREGFIARTLMSVTNPAQIEDIVVQCQTAALYRQRAKRAKERRISTEILELAIRRVVVTDEVRRGTGYS